MRLSGPSGSTGNVSSGRSADGRIAIVSQRRKVRLQGRTTIQVLCGRPRRPLRSAWMPSFWRRSASNQSPLDSICSTHLLIDDDSDRSAEQRERQCNDRAADPACCPFARVACSTIRVYAPRGNAAQLGRDGAIVFTKPSSPARSRPTVLAITRQVGSVEPPNYVPEYPRAAH